MAVEVVPLQGKANVAGAVPDLSTFVLLNDGAEVVEGTLVEEERKFLVGTER